MKSYNWAILGCGKIASKFSEDLRFAKGAKPYAVASRSIAKATSFKEKHGFEKAYGSYEELVSDPQVDIVYIATPHTLHKDHSLLAIKAGKNVLCEKAFAINAIEVKEMIKAAQENKVFLMEAFWTRFKPKFRKALELVQNKAYGDLKFLRSDFLFNGPYDPNNRLYNIDLGGGSLLDIGIYPVFMALSFLGKPEKILASAQYSPTGTEESISIIFNYKDGALASLNSSFEAWSKNDTELCFEQAALRFSRESDEDIFIEQKQDSSTLEVMNFPGHGYHLEAQHVMNCIDQGLLESPELPLSFSLDLIEVLDQIRKEVGVHYPNHDLD